MLLPHTCQLQPQPLPQPLAHSLPVRPKACHALSFPAACLPACLRVYVNACAHVHVWCGTVVQGWLPRSGLLYGCDYVVYQMHPCVVHSDYGVVVLPQQASSQPPTHAHTT